MSPFKTLTVSLARTNLRDPATMFFSYVFPPVMLVVLARSMRDFPGTNGHAIVNDISPNVLGFGIAFVGVFAGAMNIAEWREKGVVRLLRCAPMSTSSILGSALTVAFASAIVQTLLVTAVGLVPYVGVELSPWAPLSVVPVFLGTLMFYSLGVLVGLVVPTLSAASLVVMLIVMPMGVGAGAMMPLEVLPSWVQTLSRFLPMTYLLEGVRWPFTGVVDFQHAALGWLVMAVTGGALFAASIKLMRWR
ncbi:ABC transporter permease [Actinomyces trachealis]|uniref:ABC transporter permease n=1 Tax=Actinomyces trachealis TaxID=2763540 RepID=UPI0018C55B4C|nr:ABC transporter permease [Actinomyces trachealis]